MITLGKHQKMYGFLMFSESMKIDQWFEWVDVLSIDKISKNIKATSVDLMILFYLLFTVNSLTLIINCFIVDIELGVGCWLTDLQHLQEIVVSNS